MNGVRIAPARFKSMLEEKGFNPHALAREIGSTSYQMWRLMSDRHTTSFRFLARLVPVFDLPSVVDIIADEDQAEAFTWWYIEATRPRRKTV
ncbi:hypothetical protein [Microbispora siamensis]|uniref:XRE family transcriptional regulator n=1 Tax=Microbispora siamensis TaxID=564413 RepID=A0ABQ4GRB6_9ACTN|nr:hypothetical protein [Microbispora siamensis]GIH63979.1 hypothetical protein Msi02_47960 [Microbispora siamensis]